MKEIWNESCILSPSLICLDMCNLEREVKTLENSDTADTRIDTTPAMMATQRLPLKKESQSGNFVLLNLL